ncbi:MAG TPA: DUF938 domain-containing protein [Gammaproteobacteria bacterium]|nr:DUF938 domain-containing protein [Gammaproteobacteria bacterium]
MDRPYSEACEQNKVPILEVLEQELTNCRTVLEIGSGTGQHAAFFAPRLPHLQWQTSDLPVHHPGIRAWLAAAGAGNALPPIALDVAGPWPEPGYDGVFSANTAHIMGWLQVQAMFAGVGLILVPNGVFCLYGPFSYDGRHTSASNERFDQWLKARDPASGVRDVRALDELAGPAGLAQVRDHPMPANNRLLVYRRVVGA